MIKPSLIELGLRCAAVAQFGVAVINLSLGRVMKWKPELDRLPLLIAEVFRVHLIFISVTVAIFAVMTWRFAAEMALGTNAIATWLAVAIGIFWGVRAVMQWTYYSPSHWRGNAMRTALHWLLFVGYGAFVTIYFVAGFFRA